MPSSLATSATLLPSPSSRSASRSLRTTCSGVCLLPFIQVPPCPLGLWWNPHITWTSSRGSGHPCRSPRANAHCERLLGSLRRECLDWLLVWDERHLLRILRQYFCHYNHARPHRALGLRAPDPPRATAQGQV